MDTNAVIDYLNSKLPKQVATFIYNAQMNISVVTRMELLGSPNITKEELKSYNKFIAASTVFGLDEPIILKGIEIRKHYRLKLPDTIIAATASVNKLTLITRNIKDFNNIPKLALLNPWD